MSWINDLDALASAGVLEFDAPAFIKGTAPRYYGNPELQTINPNLPKIKEQPKRDEFNSSDNVIHNPAWKKWLFGGLIAAGLVFTGFKSKNKFVSFVKNLFKSKKNAY